MSVEIKLIVLLLFCVIVLSVLLILRIRREKKQLSIIKNLSIHELSEFMKKNAVEGSIVSIARLFSDILKQSFRCEYIIFLRKKRGALELNYYHGIRAFNRSDFKMDYNRELMQTLKADFFPREISPIKKYLPAKFVEKIDEFKIDQYFPVFWRDNLYGLYLIKSNAETRTVSFGLLIGQLAQSLSAAYHIKWHESKLENLQDKVGEYIKITSRSPEGNHNVSKILRLIKHRKTETIVPKLVSVLQDTANVDKLTYIYESKEGHGSLQIVNNGNVDKIDVPDHKVMSDIISCIQSKPCVSLNELTNNKKCDKQWLESLKNNEINYLASFPLTSMRKGLLAWKQTGEPKEIIEHLKLFKSYTIDLIENAEDYEKIEELSYTDNLTNLSNRRYFYKRLEEEINRAKRYQRKLALIIFDIDELKLINDTYGHQAGDSIISQMGVILKRSIRAIDVVARYGGDEFCIIMPEADRPTCEKFIERLHNKIVESNFKLEGFDRSIQCTISMGASIFPEHAESVRNLIYAADMALLEAKESGRNKSLLSTKTYLGT